MPGASGGNRARPWPQPVLDLLKKRLACKPPCRQLCRFRSLAPVRFQTRPRPGPPLGHRPWTGSSPPAQTHPGSSAPLATRSDRGTLAIGRLTPPVVSQFQHRLSHAQHARRLQPALHRLQTLRARQKPRFGTLTFCPPPSWRTDGRYSSTLIITAFSSRTIQHALTQLGWALKFYDISLRYAPTPQAKGKVEREHEFWQGRLPAYFASEKISELEEANRHIAALRHHRNGKEVHRELRQTPQCAWDTAKKGRICPAPGAPLPLVDLCLERAHPAQGRQRWPGAHWHPTPARRKTTRHPRRLMPPPLGPSLRVGCCSSSKRTARPPVYQSTQINLSCFANYKEFLF